MRKSSKNPLLTNEMLADETHLVFTNLGSEMHSKGGIANLGHPVYFNDKLEYC